MNDVSEDEGEIGRDELLLFGGRRRCGHSSEGSTRRPEISKHARRGNDHMEE